MVMMKSAARVDVFTTDRGLADRLALELGPYFTDDSVAGETIYGFRGIGAEEAYAAKNMARDLPIELRDNKTGEVLHPKGAVSHA